MVVWIFFFLIQFSEDWFTPFVPDKNLKIFNQIIEITFQGCEYLLIVENVLLFLKALLHISLHFGTFGVI